VQFERARRLDNRVAAIGPGADPGQVDECLFRPVGRFSRHCCVFRWPPAGLVCFGRRPGQGAGPVMHTRGWSGRTGATACSVPSCYQMRMPAPLPQPHVVDIVLWDLQGFQPGSAAAENLDVRPAAVTSEDEVRPFGPRAVKTAATATTAKQETRAAGNPEENRPGTTLVRSDLPFACWVKNGVNKALGDRKIVHDRAPLLTR